MIFSNKLICLTISLGLLSQTAQAQELLFSPYVNEQAERLTAPYQAASIVEEQNQNKLHRSSPYKTNKQQPQLYQGYSSAQEPLSKPESETPVYISTGLSGGYLAQPMQQELNYAQPGQTRLDQMIYQASIDTGIPFGLLKALIKKESSFNPNAISRTGAVGLTQLMPSTALYECKLSENELFDPEKNIKCGSRYLSKQIETFGDVSLALAAYNAGPGAVRRAITSTGSTDIDIFGKQLKSETIPYVKNILSNYQSIAN